MKDLTFREAVTDPEGPVQTAIRAIVEIWELLKEAYVEAGSPFGPAADVDNVARWVNQERLGG